MCAIGQTASLDLQQRFPRPQVSTDDGRLVLYYHPHNFFSQKVQHNIDGPPPPQMFSLALCAHAPII